MIIKYRGGYAVREFNVTGICVKKKHYMVDTTNKLEKIKELIDKGLYFTINRARQYGKTTTIFLLEQGLKDEYIPLWISFEGVGDSFFDNQQNFCQGFIDLLQKELSRKNLSSEYINSWKNEGITDFQLLSIHISEMTKDKKIVLMIDEVDRTSNNTVFINFLGMLRDKYLAREGERDFTFHSVILAGVYDIKNIKQKIKSEGGAAHGQKIYNSPWNIATDFKVDMSFNPEEISTMLIDYESDYNTGMDISAISKELYSYTCGYPFLVSKTCKLIDEDIDKDWTSNGIQKAIKILLGERNTLFDDIYKNLENNSELYNLLYNINVVGTSYSFSLGNPTISIGSMYGILKPMDGKVAIHNKIFEILLYEYFISKDETSDKRKYITGVLKEDVVFDNKFDMVLCLTKFSEHYYEMFNERDTQFYEKHGRLLFLSYLKPLINGIGFYYIEPETRNERRMDIVLVYEKEQFIIELKLWRGEKNHEYGYEQLWQYLDSKNLNIGYLLTFDFRKDVNKKRKAQWIEYNGKRIFDCIV